MKILMLCWRDTTHPQGGGSERYLERVAEHLVRNGHEVVFQAAKHTDAPRKSSRSGVKYVRMGGKFSVYPAAAVTMLAGRLGIGPARKVDVVVDTQNGIPFFARWFAAKPTVLLTHHCHKEQWPVAGFVLSKVGWFIESKLSPRVYKNSQYVTVSQPSRSELVALGVAEEKVTIIRNGVDPTPPVLPFIKPDEDFHVVTLSRLVPHKQIEHAIDVVKKIARTKGAIAGRRVVLDVVGSGWWEENLREYAIQQGVEELVTFHGQVAEDHKHALLNRADVHVMPSRKEGWGLAVIEAGVHGVPTIGYASSGGLQDSVIDGRTGLLVADKRELGAALETLLQSEELRSDLGTAAQAHARQYSWAKTGEQFENLLTEIAKK